MAKLTNPNEAPADETHDATDGSADEGGAAEETLSPQEKFRAALEAKKAREHGNPGGAPTGSGGGHAHGAAGGQKMFRRKSG